MIQLLSGDNAYQIEQALISLSANFSGAIEKIDGSTLELAQLPNLLMGATLFSQQRFVIISGLSAQKELWGQLSTWLERLSDDTQLVLVEPNVDKRTKTYKWLQKNASIKDCVQWRDYESGKAQKWLSDYARAGGTQLDNSIVSLMVQRAVVLSSQGKAAIDQQLLASATDTLKHSTETITESMVDAVLPPSSYENVFELLSLAISGKLEALRDATTRLELSEDGHRIAALICSQAVNLSVLNSARAIGVTATQVAKDVGVHPFALSGIDTIVSQLSVGEANGIVKRIVTMDDQIKTGQLDAWSAVATTLSKIAASSKTR